MKKTYEVIHVHDRTYFTTYEDAIEFAKNSTKPLDDNEKDDFDWNIEYNRALIIIEDERTVNGITFKMIFVRLLEFMYGNTWKITDMRI